MRLFSSTGANDISRLRRGEREGGSEREGERVREWEMGSVKKERRKGGRDDACEYGSLCDN